jgi:hypothetical protein
MAREAHFCFDGKLNRASPELAQSGLTAIVALTLSGSSEFKASGRPVEGNRSIG